MSSVDVICVTYGSAGGLGAALASAPAVGGRLVVVDHGSDGSGAIAKGLGATVIEDPSNPGFGAGQNRGAALGDGDLLLLLNPDCVLHPGAVEAGIAYLQDHPRVAAVQGVITNASTGAPERSQGSGVGPVHLWGRALGLRRLLRLAPVRSAARRVGALTDHVDRVPDEATRVESLAATAPLVRRSAFEAVGGFDPAFFLYGEDLDLCHRLRSAGWDLVALPDPWGDHIGGASSGGAVPREVVWWEGTMLFAARSWSAVPFALAMGAALLRTVGLVVRSPRTAGDIVRRVLVAPVRARR